MLILSYLSHYPEEIQQKIRVLIEQNKLRSHIHTRYPDSHQIRSDKLLYQYANNIKKRSISKALTLANVSYSNKIQVLNNALGIHHIIPRVQGNKIKTRTEIKIASVFKKVPEQFLKMIVVHELAHLKEKEHNKAFYQLCCYMEPQYHQFEFDTRLYLTYLDTTFAEELY